VVKAMAFEAWWMAAPPGRCAGVNQQQQAAAVYFGSLHHSLCLKVRLLRCFVLTVQAAGGAGPPPWPELLFHAEALQEVRLRGWRNTAAPAVLSVSGPTTYRDRLAAAPPQQRPFVLSTLLTCVGSPPPPPPGASRASFVRHPPCGIC
jgi:hypothetical protein